MKKLLFFAGVSLLIFSCDDPKSTDVPEDVNEVEDIYESVEQEFKAGPFENPKHLEILNKLNVCEEHPGDSSIIAECSPKNFKIIPFRTDKNVEQAFILQTVAGIVLKGGNQPLPLRHIIVFEEENGQYVKVNGFRGELVNTYKTNTDIKGLEISFYLPEYEIITICAFEWDNGRYSFDRVVGIDNGDGMKAVKAELQEQVNNDMLNDLMSAQLIFNEKSSI